MPHQGNVDRGLSRDDPADGQHAEEKKRAAGQEPPVLGAVAHQYAVFKESLVRIDGQQRGENHEQRNPRDQEPRLAKCHDAVEEDEIQDEEEQPVRLLQLGA